MLGSARSVMMKAPTSAPPSLPAAYAAYNFNENTGTTAADASGNGHPLALGIGGTWAVGHTGSGLSNTTTSDGASSISLTVPTTAITFMAWIKPLQFDAGQANLAFGFFNGASTIAAIFSQRDDGFGTPNVAQANVRIGSTLLGANGTALTVGTWTHITGTYDGSVVRIYQDGVLTGTSGTLVGTISSSGAFDVAGGGDGLHSQVVVDDVRVFNVVLTQAEITTAMNTPVA